MLRIQNKMISETMHVFFVATPAPFSASNTPDAAIKREFIAPKRVLPMPAQITTTLIPISKLDCTSPSLVSLKGLITNSSGAVAYAEKDGRAGGHYLTFDVTDNEGK